MEILTSVIVPVYGVEAFVERSATALMEQTMASDKMEVIFVDDASPDRSMEIIRRVVARYPDRQVKILTHSQNRGLPAARNTGMAAARGRYIVHLDSDDYADRDMVRALTDEAERTGADMVWCDWYLTTTDAGGRDHDRAMPTPTLTDPIEATRAMLGGNMKYNVWNKLTRRSVFTENAISFPDGKAMGEDLTMIMAVACCQKTARVDRPLYHYRRANTEAMTRHYSDAHLSQLKSNAERTVTFTVKHHPELASMVDNFKLQLKFPLLLMDPARRGFNLWRQWWPEANARILSNVYMSLHSRVAQFCARLRLWPIVRIYRILLKAIQ